MAIVIANRPEAMGPIGVPDLLGILLMFGLTAERQIWFPGLRLLESP